MSKSEDILILPAIPKVEEESDFMKIMIKALRYMNAPIILLFFGKQEVKPDWPFYRIPEPMIAVSTGHRIWMFFLIALIPSVLFVLNYRNILVTRRYTNAIGIWIFMFAVLALLYSKPYFEYISIYALGFLGLVYILLVYVTVMFISVVIPTPNITSLYYL
jgi:hypothetical protein